SFDPEIGQKVLDEASVDTTTAAIQDRYKKGFKLDSKYDGYVSKRQTEMLNRAHNISQDNLNREIKEKLIAHSEDVIASSQRLYQNPKLNISDKNKCAAVA